MRFIHGVWIDAGRAGAWTSLDQHGVVFDTPHAASPVEGTVCQECEALAGCFSVSRRERVTGGAGMRVSRVKANVRHSPPKCACVWMRACVFGSRNVKIVPQLILKCQSPTAAHCSYLFLPVLFTVFLVVCFLSFHCSDWQRSESQMEMFRNAGVPPKQKVTTFKVSDNALIKPGTHGR